MNGSTLGAIAQGSGSSLASGYGQFYTANQLSKRANAFSERMYQNRYTHTVNDLKRAGLNPILAVKGMSASGQPSGATASGVKMDLASSALSMRTMDQKRAEIEKAEGEVELLKERTLNMKWLTNTEIQKIQMRWDEIALLKLQITRATIDAKTAEQILNTMNAQYQKIRAISKFYEGDQAWNAWIAATADALGLGTSFQLPKIGGSRK